MTFRLFLRIVCGLVLVSGISAVPTNSDLFVKAPSRLFSLSNQINRINTVVKNYCIGKEKTLSRAYFHFYELGEIINVRFVCGKEDAFVFKYRYSDGKYKALVDENGHLIKFDTKTGEFVLQVLGTQALETPVLDTEVLGTQVLRAQVLGTQINKDFVAQELERKTFFSDDRNPISTDADLHKVRFYVFNFESDLKYLHDKISEVDKPPPSKTSLFFHTISSDLKGVVGLDGKSLLRSYKYDEDCKLKIKDVKDGNTNEDLDCFYNGRIVTGDTRPAIQDKNAFVLLSKSSIEEARSYVHYVSVETLRKLFLELADDLEKSEIKVNCINAESTLRVTYIYKQDYEFAFKFYKSENLFEITNVVLFRRKLRKNDMFQKNRMHEKKQTWVVYADRELNDLVIFDGELETFASLSGDLEDAIMFRLNPREEYIWQPNFERKLIPTSEPSWEIQITLPKKDGSR